MAAAARHPALQYLSATLECRIRRTALNPDRLNALLSNYAEVRGSMQLPDRSVYVMAPGFALNGVAISHLVVVGGTPFGSDRALLAYSTASPGVIRSKTGLASQPQGAAPFMVLTHGKTGFSAGKALTGFGCAMTGGERKFLSI